MDRTREGRASLKRITAGPGSAGADVRPHSSPLRVFLVLLPLSLLLLWAEEASPQIRPIKLEGIIVTGTPVPRTVGTETSHVTVLEGEELRDLGLSRVTEALARVPGMVVVQNGSYGSVSSTFFRGAEGDHVKVLMDGVEVNQPGGNFDFSGLLLSDVERIEVARGPASALYGSDAMAGVINIITRRGRGPLHSSLSARGGSYGRMEWAADLQGGGDNASYSLSASRMSSDGILEFNNRFETTSLSSAIYLTPDDRTRIGFTGRWGDKVYHFPTDGSGNVVDRNAYTFGDETALGVEVVRLLTERLELRGTARSYGWNGGSDDQPDDPSDSTGFFAYSSLDDFRRTSADLRGNLTIHPGAVLSAGVELQEEQQRSFSESLSEYGPSTGQSRNRRSNGGYYLHMTGESRGWSGNVGARIEDNEEYGRFFTYQAGLSHVFRGTGTRLRGNLGKGMKEPTFFETHSTGFSVGNPELEPEVSRVWEIGAEQSLGRSGGQLSLTWFNQELGDLIQYTFMPPTPGGPNYYNVAEARSRGVEVTGRLPLGPLLLSGGYTYLDTEVLDAGFDEGEGATFVKGEALIRRPQHQLGLAGLLRVSGGSVSGNLRMVGSRGDRDFTSRPAAPVELDRYVLIGVAGEFTLLEPDGSRPGFKLQVRAENLLDEDYQEVFGFRAPGRAIFLGGRLDFGG